ncbi:MAG: GatB/YqeY domain-containing protein [Balneolales bacterium]|nr:GatB/YqeY domain-containing protein [Balneolales bacterium]
MSLYETLLSDLKTAMKARDERRTLVLRSLKKEILDKEIAARTTGERTEVSDELVIEAISKAAKQRRDSITQFEDAGRNDLADVEKAELTIIEGYLPEQLGEEEITAIVDDAISQTSAEGMRDMGKVMGIVMPKVKGKADGKLVNTIVKARLT